MTGLYLCSRLSANLALSALLASALLTASQGRPATVCGGAGAFDVRPLLAEVPLHDLVQALHLCLDRPPNALLLAVGDPLDEPTQGDRIVEVRHCGRTGGQRQDRGELRGERGGNHVGARPGKADGEARLS
eukprot:CAMPEP_0179122264 /NCGR_PEP_ID=MMETSP0796-20121207/57699_1 /TAXON_ID=73915 /ORGANISM="Pyrodinium bahamense, Strain pbaha01" /LENGTH=130 /DNA_ID=CAMNT_0020820887 /DNA_START=30 /DNA_END=420 /DNA_ORIENTATION=-